MSIRIIRIEPASLRNLALFRSEKEEEACYGKYIATENFSNKEVIRDKEGKPIAHDSISETCEEVQKMGFKDPMVFLYHGPNFRPGRIPKLFIIPISRN